MKKPSKPSWRPGEKTRLHLSNPPRVPVRSSVSKKHAPIQLKMHKNPSGKLQSKLPTDARDSDVLNRDMNLLWLLRGDVREKLLAENGSAEEAKKEFVAWWLAFGRREYPDTPWFDPGYAAIVQEVVGEWNGLGITRLMRFLAQSRQDVREVCAGENGIDWERFSYWYFIYGVVEYDLFSLLTEAELDYIEAPSPHVQQDVSMPISRLMYGVWAWQRDLSAAFNLAERAERESYVAWFYIHGLGKHHYFKYIRLPHAIRLCEPVPYMEGDLNPPVTRLMWYLWLAENGLREKIDITTREGRIELRSLLYDKLYAGAELKPLWDILNSNLKPLPGFQPKGLFDNGPDTSGASYKPHLAGLDPARLGVNLVGYAMGELGIGEDVRMITRALESAGIPFCILNRQPGKEIRQMDFSMTRHLSAHPRYPITLICMTAFDTAAFWLNRPDIFQNTYVIGCWPWELPEWPRDWHKVYGLVDEVWSSSHYTLRAFAADSPVPVLHMPMVVTIDEREERSRADFGLPEARFLFLFVFDFMSYPARKNPEACVEAFLRAFPQGDEPVNLVLKVSNAVHDSPLWALIDQARTQDPRIVLLDATLDKGAVLGLMQVCDAYVSLHRAEGFGRTLAEAMLMGKPVIATDYSGSADYLSEATGIPVPHAMVAVGATEYPCGEGQSWAEPDIDGAAAKMRAVFLDYPRYSARGTAAREYILQYYSPGPVGGRISHRLAELIQRP